MVEYGLYIGGSWVAPKAGKLFDAVNPFTGECWARVSEADAADVDHAVTAATTAQVGWAATNGATRARILNNIADIITENAKNMAVFESTDNGKVIRETESQMLFAARLFRFYAGYADKLFGSTIPLDSPSVLDYTTREPYGVVGLITAWNSPITLLCNKLPAALAAGNTVIVKPSEHASVSTLELCKLFEKAELPAGVVNVVTGAGPTGAAIVTHPGISKVSFTGSPVVGRKIAATAGEHLKPVTLELGGKSPNIIFDDADPEAATIGALAGIFGATGQTCVAGSRLLVQRGLYDEIVSRLAARAEEIRLGDPLDHDSEMGTVANKPQFDRIIASIEAAKSAGARLVTGGGAATGDHLGNGLFVQPTIFADVENSMDIAQSEIFGPVLSILPFDTEEEAVQIANDIPFGLAAGIWTRDISRAMRLVPKMKSGVVWVNTYRVVAAQAPFGGTKESGFGRERGEQGIMEFTSIKNVMIDYSDQARDPFAIKN
ncbi:aldehyde dehydrogenase (NAD+) [Roseovarius pacificus]|uniref:Aldehyde dehydrogenase (NAD+) n=1 Tax=Roseovarius pacificus TaxID=337701 RepID=A0A1M7GZ72_9RHOB|nr:aldehyde dehydrogenase [Roseovarius pacificus]GGO60067.1 aldehyde dehydrogenase [Roseovarius pacificus]SHM21621.1 aldehyde dehydrogenase (NAD+) [Roseovarius pacificus]